VPGPDDREQRTPPTRDSQRPPEPDETRGERPRDRLDESGGQRYQQAHRAPGSTEQGEAVTAGARTALARETAEPDQRQRADEHGGPGPDDESWLAEQGYPKLGKKIQSRVTQVEHGPYAGGTQQGDASSREQ
jgi:hypothetical protein